MSVPLSLRSVEVGYKTRRHTTTVLSGITASMNEQEFVGLVGPNGAGKSTLLRSIAGLQPVLAGEVELGGVPTHRLSRKEMARTIATVLTDRVTVPRMTVNNVVALGRQPHLGFSGRLTAHDRAVVAESLAAVGATGLADANLDELSDGQRQRVMVARALAQQPAVLLLDEPTSFLDPPARISLLSLLRRTCTERRIAVVVCSHDIEPLMRYADTLWVAGPEPTITTGAPEDVARSGLLDQAFHTPGITFDLETLNFWQDNAGWPTAFVTGTDGTDIALARHVLTRSGYAVVDRERPDTLVVTANAQRWTVRGETFTSLAQLHEYVVRLRPRG